MNNLLKFLLILAFFGQSCKSSYDKIRTSGNAPLVLKAANQYYAKKNYLKAQTLYELIISSFKGQKESEDIYFNFAYCHYYLSEFELSSHLFKNFSNTFVNSPKREEALFMSNYAIYKTSPNYKLDQSGTEKAIEGFQSFVNEFPESSRVKDCNEKIDELRSKLETKAFEQGKLYYNVKSYQACLTTLDNLMVDFPETKNHREIRFLKAKANYEWAVNSIFEKQKERFLSTVELTNQFLKKYPSGKFVQDIKEIRKQALSKSNNPLYDRYQNASSGN